MVHNVHTRQIEATIGEVGALIDSLSSGNDRLWPRSTWPAMRFDGPLGVGAVGGHGPIRYVVVAYRPSRFIQFRFTGPTGFDGYHSFFAEASSSGSTLLRHELRMMPRGWAIVSWPLVFRPLHDALIEECFDQAERATEAPRSVRARRTWWVKTLRAVLSARLRSSR